MQVSAESGSIEYAGEMVDLTDAISRLPAGESQADPVIPIGPDSNCRYRLPCLGIFQSSHSAAILFV